RPRGSPTFAAGAAAPSGDTPEPPLPATVDRTVVAASIDRIAFERESARTNPEGLWTIEKPSVSLVVIAAIAAGWPFPTSPPEPSPAIVVITWFVATRRTDGKDVSDTMNELGFAPFA